MGRITGKRQVTIPKSIADEFDLQAGDDLEWVVAGDVIRVIPPGRRLAQLDVKTRLELYDAATARIARQDQATAGRRVAENGRGWTREDLYDRGRSR